MKCGLVNIENKRCSKVTEPSEVQVANAKEYKIQIKITNKNYSN